MSTATGGVDAPGWRGARVDWAVLVATAAFVRLVSAFVALDSLPIKQDPFFYTRDARLIVDRFPGPDSFFWPPGTSYALAAAYALVGDTLTTTRLVGVGVGVALAVMVRLLAGELLGGRREALVAGWIAALYPATVLMTGIPYSYPFGSLWLVTLAYLVVVAHRRHRAVVLLPAGLAFGALALTRPNALSVLVALGVGGFELWRRTGREGRRATGRWVARGAIAFAIGAAAVIAPVAAHNAAGGEGAVISTNGELNVWLGNNPYTPKYKTTQLNQRTGDELDPAARRYLNRFTERPGALETVDRDAVREEVRRYVTGHPADTLLRTVNRIRAFWGFDYFMASQLRNYTGWSTPKVLLVAALEASGFVLVVALAAWGLAFERPRRKGGVALFLLALVAAYQLPYALSVSNGVYHFPVMPLLMPLAAAGLVGIRERPERVGPALRTPAVIVAVVVFVLVQLEYGLIVARNI